MQDIKRINNLFGCNKKSPTTGLNLQGKDNKKIRNQVIKVTKAFSNGASKTMLQVSIETGILRANICRYVAVMKKQETIFLIKKGICPISKHRAGFYTTNLDVLSYGKQ